MKRAFLVTGAEHSGNRLMTGLLCSAGVWGRGSNQQPKWHEINSDEDQVAVIAHLKEDLESWVELFRLHHEIHVIVMARDPWVQRRSRAKAAGQSQKEGYERYLQDYTAAFSVIMEHQLLFTIVPYECLLWPGSEERILSLFGLEQKGPLVVQGNVTEIRDENGKWYAD